MRKKVLLVLVSILLISVLTVGLVSCGDNNKGSSNQSSESPTYYVYIHPNNGEETIKWDISTDIPNVEYEGYEIEGFYFEVEFTTPVSIASIQAAGLSNDLDIYIKWKKIGM